MPDTYLSTMALGAGFYMSAFGLLPYAFGKTSGDPYDVYRFFR